MRRVSPKDEPSTSCEKVRRRGICETNQSGVKNFELPIIQEADLPSFLSELMRAIENGVTDKRKTIIFFMISK